MKHAWVSCIIGILFCLVLVSSKAMIHQFQILNQVDLDPSTFEVRFHGTGSVSMLTCLAHVASTSTSSTLILKHEDKCIFKSMGSSLVSSLPPGIFNAFFLMIPGISPAMLNKTITITSHSCRKQLGSGSEIEMGCGTSIFDNNSATSEDFLHEDRVKISLKNNNDPHLPAPDFNTVAIQLEMATSNLPLSVTLAWGQIPECDNHQRILTQTFSKNGFLLVKEMNSGEFSSGNCFSILFQMPPNEKRLTVQDIYYIKI